MRSPSLNCSIPSPEILKRFYAKILSLLIEDEKKEWVLSKNLKRLIGSG
ncbi:MAG: hypothetical protein ABSG44_10915 [Thermodesulfobacteriota bacterium]|jgi:hypothetical protein